jgi:MYXO-CTERM domain-containing protein
VIDPSGVEGRLVDAFTALSAPRIDARFPAAGDFAGGTEVVLTGDSFEPGLVVRIDGIPQPSAMQESASLVRFTTVGGPVGGPYVLEVENPDGAIATSQFTYAAQADPALGSLDPAGGSSAGGDEVTVQGANFTADLEVVFGADGAGVGGVPAASVTFVDGNTLLVETPAHPAGPASVLLRDAVTGQGDFLEAAFVFSGGGGGGGCSVSPVSPPSSPRRALEGAGWVAALLAWLFLRARRARRTAPSV